MAHNRTAWGELQPNPTAFPNGMKAVADYVSIQMRFIIKSVSNNNGNGNDWHVKKAIVLRNKTTTLQVQHTFLYISLPSMHGYIFSFFLSSKLTLGPQEFYFRKIYQNRPKGSQSNLSLACHEYLKYSCFQQSIIIIDCQW